MKLTEHPLFEVPTGRDHPIARCRDCEAPIWWVKTRAGKNMPLSLRRKVERDGKLFAPCHFTDCTGRHDIDTDEYPDRYDQ